MLKIEGGQFVDAFKHSTFDSYGNPDVTVTIQGDHELIAMQTNVLSLESRVTAIENRDLEEKRLIAANPALKDIHDKYQIVYELVKKADSATGNGSG
jgi:hypothetical protein